MGMVSITPKERRRLLRVIQASTNERQRRRIKALLGVADGSPVSQVAASLGVSRQFVYNCVERFEQGCGATAMGDSPKLGRPRLWDEQSDAALQECMQSRPSEWGYESEEWTKPLVQQWFRDQMDVDVSRTWVMQRLHHLGFRWDGNWKAGCSANSRGQQRCRPTRKRT